MRKIFVILALLVTLSACAGPAPVSAPTMTLPSPTATRIPLTSTPTEVLIPTLQPVIQEIRMLSVSGESFQAQVVDDPNAEITMAVRSDVENGFYVIKDGEWVQFDIAHPMDSWSQSTKDQIAASKNPTVAADRYFEQQIQYLLQADGEDVALFERDAQVGSSEWAEINDNKMDRYLAWLQAHNLIEATSPVEWIAGNMNTVENFTVSLPESTWYGYDASSHHLTVAKDTSLRTNMSGYPINALIRNGSINVVGELGAVITALDESRTESRLLAIKLDHNSNDVWTFRRLILEATSTHQGDIFLEIDSGGLNKWKVSQIDDEHDVGLTQGRHSLNNNTLPIKTITLEEILSALRLTDPVIVRSTTETFWINGIPVSSVFSYNIPQN